MGSTTLATTKHFIIQWWNGCDSNGIFIYQPTDNDEAFPFLNKNPQAFIHFDYIQSLIEELKVTKQHLVIKNRVPNGVMMHANRRYNLPPMPFVPYGQRKPKKDGGVWGQAYYTPLPVSPEHFGELVNAIKSGCSQENVKHLESINCNEGWYVLNGRYLNNSQWCSIHTDEPLLAFPIHNDAVLGGGARPSSTDAVMGNRQ